MNYLSTKEENLKNLVSPPVSKVIASQSQVSAKDYTSKKSIPKRVSRVKIVRPPQRYGDDKLFDKII